MNGVIVGIAENGERLRFEAWVYWRWRDGTLQDADLLTQLRRCVRFLNIEF